MFSISTGVTTNIFESIYRIFSGPEDLGNQSKSWIDTLVLEDAGVSANPLSSWQAQTTGMQLAPSMQGEQEDHTHV